MENEGYRVIKRVRCIKDAGVDITVGNVYDALAENEDEYAVVDDSGIDYWYDKDFFEVAK